MNLPVIPALFDSMTSLVIAEFGVDGQLLHGNAGFRRLCAGSSMPSWYIFTQPRLDGLVRAPADENGVVYQGLITLGDADGEMRTLSGTIHCGNDRLLIVAGYDINEFEATSDLLFDLNNQLDLTHRDLVRTHRELAQREAVIRELSLTDALTGVGNRRLLDDTLLAESERARRYGLPLTLFILDIDHFKRVNDTWGHVVGDEVLRDMGALLRGFLRQSDSASRLGGEEFVVLMPGTGLADATAAANRLCRELAAQVRANPPPSITASFGVASLQGEESGTALLARADAALYRAKTGGRNQVVADQGYADSVAAPCHSGEISRENIA
jgi:diguanylate cyclase (GGDEF)-like protein